MEANAGDVRCLMSHFRNRQNMLIRTYSAAIPNAKGAIVLVHGNRCHFRAEFAAYNLDWYLDAHRIGVPAIDDVVKAELRAVYPADAVHRKGSAKAEFPSAFALDGKNMFDISPRFVYEGSFIQRLNQLGYTVYGLDHQSTGMSEGQRGKRNFYTSLEHLVDDVIQFVDIVKRGKFENTEEAFNESVIGGPSTIGKVYLAGISMGGNIVLRVAQKTAIYNKGEQKFVDGVMAFAPMTDLSSYTVGLCKKIQLAISKCIACFNPSSTLFVGDDRIIDNMNGFVRYQDPHYYSDRQCYAVILSLLDATERLSRNHHLYPRDLPTIVMHCTHDDVCSIKGTYSLVRKHLKDHSDLQFVELEGSVHCVTSFLYVDKIMPHVTAWLKKVNV